MLSPLESMDRVDGSDLTKREAPNGINSNSNSQPHSSTQGEQGSQQQRHDLYPEKRRFRDAVGRLFVHYEKKFRAVETDKKGQEFIVY